MNIPLNNTFFTSDIHFGHSNIIRHCDRPFDDVNEMNERLVERINSMLNDDSHLFILGDLSFLRPSRTLGFVSRIKGYKYLIRGNHDNIRKWSEELRNEFVWIKDYHELHIQTPQSKFTKKNKICMMHYPIMSWNKQRYGTYMLHGHMHSSQDHYPDRLLYDVGVDNNNWYPVSLNEIVRIMEEDKTWWNKNQSQ